MKLFDVYSLFDVTPIKAKDVYVYDDAGNEYLDLYELDSNSVGHSHPLRGKHQITTSLYLFKFNQTPYNPFLAEKSMSMPISKIISFSCSSGQNQ